jgi:transposase
MVEDKIQLARNEDFVELAETFKQMYDEFIRVGFNNEISIFLTLEFMKQNYIED